MKKYHKIMISFLFMFSIFAGLVTPLSAEGKTVDVTLHKRSFAQAPEATENTGLEMPDFGGEPLNGAEFSVYDVTEKYHELVKKDPNKTEAHKNAIAAIAADATNNKQTQIGTPVVSANAGEARFTGLELKKGALDAVYLFLETKSPADVSVVGLAAPIVLAMPIYDGDVLNESIHLYPKNVLGNDQKILTDVNGAEFVVNGGVVNVSTGDLIAFDVILNVPRDIVVHEHYSLTDTPTNGLEFQAGSLSITGADLTEATDYTVVPQNGGFKLEFNITTSAEKIAGKQLVVSYKMKLTAAVDLKNNANNKAQVTVGTTPQEELITTIRPEPEVPVRFNTGGYKFTKEDSHTGLGLQGATFKVTNQGDLYGVFTFDQGSQSYVFSKWVSTADEATLLESSADGTFAVKGLHNGEYKLHEVDAPSDKYVKLDKPINFTVVAGEYETSHIAVLNIPKGLLPATGGSGIYGFLIVGGLMMVSALVWNRKTQKTK